jgi:hypothetical protein
MAKGAAILVNRVETKILLVREHRVLLDADLSELYGAEISVQQQLMHDSRRDPV